MKKTQKEALLKWIGEGLSSGEINELAEHFPDSFDISRQQLEYYRRTRKVRIAAIIKSGQESALSEGLALKGERVTKLKQLAALIELDIFGGFLWLDNVKGVGSGDIAELVDYEEFNAGEVAAYRGVLDDIAKEVGGRVQKQVIAGDPDAPIAIATVNVDQAKL